MYIFLKDNNYCEIQYFFEPVVFHYKTSERLIWKPDGYYFILAYYDSDMFMCELVIWKWKWRVLSTLKIFLSNKTKYWIMSSRYHVMINIPWGLKFIYKLYLCTIYCVSVWIYRVGYSAPLWQQCEHLIGLKGTVCTSDVNKDAIKSMNADTNYHSSDWNEEELVSSVPRSHVYIYIYIYM